MLSTNLIFSLRYLFRRPRLTLASILALALGIGATSSMFSVINSVLLHPLPFPEEERLVLMWEKIEQMEMSVAYPNFRDWRQQNRVFEDLAASRIDNMNLTGEGEPERLQVRMVSSQFFNVLGVPPARGRSFTETDDFPGADPVVILDHGFWQSRYGNQSVIGRKMVLDDRSFAIIGVTHKNFEYSGPVDVYVPLGLFGDRFESRGSHPGIWVVGRLKDGVTLERARDHMNQIMDSLAAEYPQTNRGHQVVTTSLYEAKVGEIRPTLLLLLGAVVLLLLIACANVANLQVVRALNRDGEVAIRQAMGASRRQLICLFLTESLLLALTGGMIGYLFATWGNSALLAMAPPHLAGVQEASLDLTILLFALAISLLTGILFGIAPALYGSRVDVVSSLKERGAGSKVSRKRFFDLLVTAEVALAAILVLATALLASNFSEVRNSDLGFDSEGLLTLQLSRSHSESSTVAQATQFFSQLQSRIESLPGARSATFSNGLPFTFASEDSFVVAGRPTPPPDEIPAGVSYHVAPGYFETLGIPLIKGRYFDSRDHGHSRPVAIIDESLAQEHFPEQDPIGRMIAPDDEPLEIIGVVKHVRHYGLGNQAPVSAQFYVPFSQVSEDSLQHLLKRMQLAVRTDQEDSLTLYAAVRAEILALDADQPVFDILSMENRVDQSLAAERFSVVLMTTFGMVSLVLAIIGLYGIISYSVTRRTGEIGIRMALGASRSNIVAMVLSRGVILAAAGTLTGLLMTLLLGRLLVSTLPHLRIEPATLLLAAPILFLTTTLICTIPGARAARLNPSTALRHE